MAFTCPPDCGWCCTHLKREEEPGEAEFRDALRDEGIYSCGHAPRGLSLSPAEADGMRDEAKRRGLRVDLHPRTYLLDARRRAAVVLDWHWDHVSCPFYADYKCTAYDARPLVCRAFPVLLGAPKWTLAPQCPMSEPTLASGARLGTALRVESAARRGIERAHVRMDEDAARLLAHGGFAKGLAPTEARARLRRYRLLKPEEHPACAARARS